MWQAEKHAQSKTHVHKVTFMAVMQSHLDWIMSLCFIILHCGCSAETEVEKRMVFTTTTGSYLTTALETAQVVIPSFMWLKHVACRSAAADLPRKRPTVQQCPGHLLTPLAPISISGLAEGAICSKCSPVPVNCVLCGVYMVALKRHPEKAINQLRLQSESHQAHLWKTLRHHHFWTNAKLLHWKAGSMLYRLGNDSPHIIKTTQTKKLWRTSMNRGRQTPQAWITKTPRMGSVPSNLLIEFFGSFRST